ncbi:bacteriohemerythrin [Pseudomonas sp. Marseille-QA0892]
MAYLAWEHDLDTGIDVIDQQHRRIIEMINWLEDVQSGVSGHTTEDVVNELLDYTISHFAFEEALMEEAGYRFSRAHKRVHEVFIKRVEGLRSRFKDGEDITLELRETLGRWLISHIRNDDRNYVEAVSRNLQRLTTDSSPQGWLARAVKRFFHHAA